MIVIIGAENAHAVRRRVGNFTWRSPRSLIFLSQTTNNRLIEKNSSYSRSLGECENKVNQKRNRNPDFSVPVYPIFNLDISVALFLVSLALLEYLYTPGFPCALGTERG